MDEKQAPWVPQCKLLKLDNLNNSTTRTIMSMAPTTARTTIATRTLKTSRKGKEKETRGGKVTVMKGLSDASGIVQALGELSFIFFLCFLILTKVS
jgi:hypothetical protein